MASLQTSASVSLHPAHLREWGATVFQDLSRFENEALAVLALKGQPMTIDHPCSDRENVCIFLLNEGRMTLQHKGGEVELDGGTFLTCRSGLEFELVLSRPYDMVVVRIAESVLARWIPNWFDAELVPIQAVAEGKVISSMVRDLADCGSRFHNQRSAEVAEEAIVRLLANAIASSAMLHAESNQAERHRQRVRKYCREHLRSGDLNIRSVAKAVGVSSAHLHRLFRNEPSKLGAWMRQERLEAVRGAIEGDVSGTKTLTEIALAHGFDDAGHFSRAFKRCFGIPPRQFKAHVLESRQSRRACSDDPSGGETKAS
jgi:AraC-like DNA-binding protein